MLKKYFSIILTFFVLFSSFLSADRYQEIHQRLVRVNQSSESISARFSEICEIYWDFLLVEFPEYATYVGCNQYNHRWTDYSLESIDRQAQTFSNILQTLLALDVTQLTQGEKLSFELLKLDLLETQEELSFHFGYLCIHQMNGVHLDIGQTIAMMPTETLKDYENILARLKAVPLLLDQTIGLMNKGIETGITPPKITLRDVSEQVLSQITQDPVESVFFLPFKQFPDSFSKEIRVFLTEEAKNCIQQQVFTSFHTLHDYLEQRYIPSARETIALSDLPQGKAMYAFKVRSLTTTDLTPQQIHQIGLAEVKRIDKEMRLIIKRLRFKGRIHEFFTFLKTSPQFYYTKREDLLQGYREIIAKIETCLPQLFGKLPSLPCEVVAVPAHSEKAHSGAYYMGGSLKTGRPGYFFVNAYDLPARPMWEMESLALHEALPGHHLQITLSQEMQHIPKFRHYARYTAFIEGWGLYSEGLGKELGLYQDPYSQFGRLTMEMMRSVRLVVDTGMHAFGWSRERAIDYFKSYTAIDEDKIIGEVDRYLVMPGQALAYKIGELKIQELRRQAKKTLGNRFDIRAFHDQLLSEGAVPLNILEEIMKPQTKK